MITLATSAGRESIGTWLVGSSIVFAFIALASGDQTDVKVIGTGLAGGILLDATVVRMLLVPALVSLFGRWNWWLPHLPARVLHVEPSRLPAVASETEAA